MQKVMKSKDIRSSRIYQKRGLFFSIGLVIALLLVITAFEWRTYTASVVDLESVIIEDDTYLEIPVTEIQPPRPKVIRDPIIEELKPEEIADNIPDFKVDIEPDEVIPDITDLTPIPDEVVEKIHQYVQIMPEPVGGYEAFYKHLYKEIQYPNIARRGGVEGRVFISFVVDKDGSITDIELVSGIGAGCDEEAMRALESVPRWSPGIQGGVRVKVRMIIPVTFKLQ